MSDATAAVVAGLIADLRSIGLAEGDAVALRCATRPIAPNMKGVAALLLEALLQTVGPAGTVIASTHTEEEIREFVGADSLGYLSIQGVLAALELPYERFCFACFDGHYPEPVPYDAAARKFVLEEGLTVTGRA